MTRKRRRLVPPQTQAAVPWLAEIWRACGYRFTPRGTIIGTSWPRPSIPITHA